MLNLAQEAAQGLLPSTGVLWLDQLLTFLAGLTTAVTVGAPFVRSLIKQIRALVRAIEEDGREDLKARAHVESIKEGCEEPLARTVKKTTMFMDADKFRKHLEENDAN